MHGFLFEWRFSAPLLAALIVLVMALLHFAAGSFDAGHVPEYFQTDRTFLGAVLMLILMPAYLAACFIYGLRRSVELARIVDGAGATRLVDEVKRAPWVVVAGCALVGLLYAILLNLPLRGAEFFSNDPVDQLLGYSQSLVWISLWSLAAYRVHVARAFHAASETIQFDLFEPSSLKPFAQVGLVDVLTITLGLVLSTVQALDLEFRPENYDRALVLVVPALLFLFIYPMWGLHQRMRAARSAALEELNQRIMEASKSLEPVSMAELEVLLQRRERTRDLPTWPVDIRVLQRLLFYIILPPLAWVASALVEFALGRLIG